MELIYNELSVQPLSADERIANEKIINLIKTYKAVQKNGFRKIRFSKHFHDLQIAPDYTIQKWLDDSKSRTHRDIFLGIYVYPFMNYEKDEKEVMEYLDHTYSHENIPNGFNREECKGLGAAYVYNTLAISFPNHEIWKENIIEIVEEKDESEKIVSVVNIFSDICAEENVVTTFIEQFKEVTIVESNLEPTKKPIHFRDDHGNDVLLAFAKRLVNSKYVEGIINSIAWKSQETKFIRKVNSDGTIELRLHWDDRGLGMIIQTTGRNQRETFEIAKHINTEYGHC